MFDRIKDQSSQDLMFRVEVSFLEIYMEKVKDLLNPAKSSPNLKVRQSPTAGVFVEGLKKFVRVSVLDDVS